MKTSRLLYAIFLAGFCVSGARAQAPLPVQLVGESSKVCQLTGETDWKSGQPTEARTKTNGGLTNVDLGYPLEHAGKLIFLFGDSWPPDHPKGSAPEVPPDDGVGSTKFPGPPSAKECLKMALHRNSDGNFIRPTVGPAPGIKQGFFNVPSGGISVNDKLFAFFWTNHCGKPTPLLPRPNAPLKAPGPSTNCVEASELNSLGIGELAWSADGGNTYTNVGPMPTGFVYSSAVNVAGIGGLPPSAGIVVLGAARYRSSIPYLAYAHPKTFSDISKWHFFTGLDAEGQPQWVSYSDWTKGSGGSGTDWKPPGQAEMFAASSNADRCVGEHSLTWNAPLQRWLLVYNCKNDIVARIASAPWGPWSAPTVLISNNTPGIRCNLVMDAGGCPGQENDWPQPTPTTFVPGGFYAPFVLDRYTVNGPAGSGFAQAITYWLVSTWNPYQVIVMKSILRDVQERRPPLPIPHLPLPPGEGPVKIPPK
ncbi:MAG TPA: DUF4185 domain-containing protein [Candidatus Angelobacter sp.]